MNGSMKIRKILYWAFFWIAFVYSFWVIVFKYAHNFSQIKIIWAGPIAGAVALCFAALKIHDIMLESPGTDEMKKISDTIYKGAMTFLKKEYWIMSLFIIVLAAFLALKVSTGSCVCFIVGAITSALAGFIGMSVSTKSNARTANAAQTSLNSAFKIAFSGGLVMGVVVVGLAMIALPVLYLIYKDPEIIAGFGFGASLVALFARVGGGIFTKAADIGADLVGKVEHHIPEDDPRNPATIADNVGDNVGDVAGMGADLFESFAGTLIAAITLGTLVLDLIGAFLPLTIAATGIFCCILASCLVRTKENGSPMVSMQVGTVVSILLLLAVSYYLINYVFLQGYDGVFLALASGVVAGCLIGFSTQYYTSSAFKPVKSIIKATVTGAATTVISGFRVGMLSTFFPLVVIALTSIFAFVVIGGMGSYYGGVYGVCLASVGMLSTVGIIIAVDAYGPIADNAGGIAQMAKLGDEVRKRTDKLDAAGNTTAAIGKGFAIGSAALTALSLLSAFAMTINLEQVDVLNPFVVTSLIFGASLPFLFCALSMGAVGSAAEKMVKEVRRQFDNNPQILEGTAEPDYQSCIRISAKSAIMRMIPPGLIAIVAPLAVSLTISYLFGRENGSQALGGLLIGAIASGVCLAIMMSNSGGAWDNAKKKIEEGDLGGKGSLPHECAIIGDTVGDPLKDTSGPSLNILIKLMTIMALVCAGLFMD